MLNSIEPIKIPITLCGKEMYLRYNLNARLYLEHYYPNVDEFMGKDSDSWTVDDVVHLLRAGLMDFNFEKNEQAISKRDFDAVVPSLAGVGRLVDEIGLREITMRIIEGLIASYPQVPVGADENFSQTPDQAASR